MPVMIQHVDESNETARIYEVTNPKRELTVPVNSLEEI
nr:Small, acid-soluble spore protein H [Bacillus wiedmannii]